MNKKTVTFPSGAKVQMLDDNQKDQQLKGVKPPPAVQDPGVGKDPRQIINNLLDKHREQLEIYAAAFLKHVGSDKAADYVLIHQQFPNRMIYRYELKTDIAKITENHDILVAALTKIATPGEMIVPVTVRKVAAKALADVGEKVFTSDVGGKK